MDQLTFHPSDADPAVTRVAVIRGSLRCLAFGVAGLVPVLGLPFGIAALVVYFRSSLRSAGEWNPIRRQLIAGLCFGILSLVEHALLATIIAVLAAEDAGLLK